MAKIIQEETPKDPTIRTERIYGWSYYFDLVGDVDIAIKKLQQLKTKYPQYYKFELIMNCSGSTSYVSLLGYRHETDVEKETRLDAEKETRLDAEKENNQILESKERIKLRGLVDKRGIKAIEAELERIKNRKKVKKVKK
jgi:hypothetical protein